jgi:hypothetical protein
LLLDGTGRTVQSGTALPGARVTVPAGLAPGMYHFRDATGRTVQQNVLTAIKNVDDAKVALQQARSDHLVAIIELERLKGSL